MEKFLSGGWVAALLALPFYSFTSDQADAHWAIKLLVFIAIFAIFTWLVRSIVLFGDEALGLPWYLPLAVFVYPLAVVNHFAPEPGWFLVPLTFVASLAFAGAWLSCVGEFKSDVWQCERCGKGMTTYKNEVPLDETPKGCVPEQAWLNRRKRRHPRGWIEREDTLPAKRHRFVFLRSLELGPEPQRESVYVPSVPWDTDWDEE